MVTGYGRLCGYQILAKFNIVTDIVGSKLIPSTEQKLTSFSLIHFVEETSPVDGDTAKLELAKAEAKVESEV